MKTIREALAKALEAQGWTLHSHKGGRWIYAHPDHGRNHYILGQSGSIRYGTAHSNSRALSERAREVLLNTVSAVAK